SLRAGIRASEVEQFIDAQHRALGADQGNTFCIVSFGEDTSLPHGGESDRVLKENDAVLIDTGTQYDGYNSDITRSYVFGEPSAEYARVWTAEKESRRPLSRRQNREARVKAWMPPRAPASAPTVSGPITDCPAFPIARATASALTCMNRPI